MLHEYGTYPQLCFIRILFSHLSLGLPVAVPRLLVTLSIPGMRLSFLPCTSHFIRLEFIALVTSDEQYDTLCFSLCSFRHPPAVSSRSVKILFSNAINLAFFSQGLRGERPATNRFSYGTTTELVQSHRWAICKLINESKPFNKSSSILMSIRHHLKRFKKGRRTKKIKTWCLFSYKWNIFPFL
jgi:hypothetical protein